MDYVQFTEIAMLVLFGISWPFNIRKSWKSRTAKGKSILFECLVVAGYTIGLSGKFVTVSRTGTWPYSIWFYLADITMVTIDLVLSVRNARLDAERDRLQQAGS